MDAVLAVLLEQAPTLAGLIALAAYLGNELRVTRQEAAKDREWMKQLIIMLLEDRGLDAAEVQRRVSDH